MSINNPGFNKENIKQYDFSSGFILKANQSMSFLGIEKDEVIQPMLVNGMLTIGPLSWSPEQLTEEINKGVWIFQATS